MKKERLKNLLLVFLIMMNFVLGSRILTDKKLWPSGYNFFSNMDIFDISKWYSGTMNYFKGEEKDNNQILMPEKIIINTGDQTTRLSLNSSDAEFYELAEQTGKLLKEALENKKNQFNIITKDEMYSSLSADSLYLKYYKEYNVDLVSELLGGKNNNISDKGCTFSDVLVTYSPKTVVYIADIKSEKYYKTELPKTSKELERLLENCIKKRAQSQTNIINYSFDLGFDEPFGTQKTILNPFIQIHSTSVQMPSIKAENPFEYESGYINEELANSVLEIFNISPDTISRYKKADGGMVFVENNATMTIDIDGYIEYEATDSGIKISDGKSKYSDINGVLKIIDKVNSLNGRENEMFLSDSENENGEMVFDYRVSGVKVEIDYKNISSGVLVKVENGRLKSYKQLVRKYTVTNNMTTPMEFFTALDNAIFKYSEFMNEIKIEKMDLGYRDDGNAGEKSAEWIVKVDNVIVKNAND